MTLFLRRFLILIVAGIGGMVDAVSGQGMTRFADKSVSYPNILLRKVGHKTDDLYGLLSRQMEKYLRDLAKEEQKMKRLLAKKDSTVASRLFNETQQQYAELVKKVRRISERAADFDRQYLGHLDSVRTALKYLGANISTLAKLSNVQEQVTSVVAKMDRLQDRFTQAEEVRRFVEKRKRMVIEQMNRFKIGKRVKAFQKKVYYYKAQVEEYKRMYNDPSDMEKKALALLQNSAVYKEFFKKNSELASLFIVPGTLAEFPTSVAQEGHTLASTQKELLQRYGGQATLQNMSAAADPTNTAIDQIKRQLTSHKTGDEKNGEQAMQKFKPNDQMVKRFLNRIEYGTNLQTVKANYIFPSTSDIGLSLGYKINNTSVVGIGASYKMGWGKTIRHIQITHQGIGLRSFLDYKIKGNFWMAGGAEINYRSQFKSFEVLNEYSAWQKSVLIGLSKRYRAGKKLKGTAQILYDFLYKQQTPKTQAILFRVGYSIK